MESLSSADPTELGGIAIVGRLGQGGSAHGRGADEPKVIDFGLAALADTDGDITRTLGAVLTFARPGPAHIHGVRSLSMPGDRETALIGGFWAGLPTDYLLRITKTEHFDVANVRTMMPALDSCHPLAAPLLLRTLRLNCLTTAYADLWSELYEEAWHAEQWAVDWPGVKLLDDVGPEWEYSTPLRTEYERRAALVEIDALVAVWLGITEEQLEAIYPARSPVLGDYEDVTWFDATGRKIAGNWNTYGTGIYGTGIAEYRQAHAAFTERLAQAQGVSE